MATSALSGVGAVPDIGLPEMLDPDLTFTCGLTVRNMASFSRIAVTANDKELSFAIEHEDFKKVAVDSITAHFLLGSSTLIGGGPLTSLSRPEYL
jgi:hypothetical protein